jgi:hypothetical protein
VCRVAVDDMVFSFLVVEVNAVNTNRVESSGIA